MAGTLYHRAVSAAIGVRAEYTEISSDIATKDFSDIARRVLGFGDLCVRTFDRPVYPRSGFSMNAAVNAAPAIGDAENFSCGFISLETVLPMYRSIVAFANGFFGAGSQTTMPVLYGFSLGGVRKPAAYPYTKISQTTLMGVREQELIGDQLQMLGLGMRIEAFKDGFLELRVNAGNTFSGNDIVVAGRKYLGGSGMTFGYLSSIGPLEFAIMRCSIGTYLPYINIGFDF